MHVYQLDLFKTPEECRMEALEKEVDRLRISLDRQRKSQFAKIGEQTKEILELRERLDVIERGLCKNEITPNI